MAEAARRRFELQPAQDIWWPLIFSFINFHNFIDDTPKKLEKIYGITIMQIWCSYKAAGNLHEQL